MKKLVRHRIEQETVIVFNEAERNCTLGTASAPIKRKMQRLGYRPDWETEEWAEFTLPKAKITIRRFENRHNSGSARTRKGTFAPCSNSPAPSATSQ